MVIARGGQGCSAVDYGDRERQLHQVEDSKYAPTVSVSGLALLLIFRYKMRAINRITQVARAQASSPVPAILAGCLLRCPVLTIAEVETVGGMWHETGYVDRSHSLQSGDYPSQGSE